MAVTYPLDLPSVAKIGSLNWTADDVVGDAVSPFTRQSELQVYEGDALTATLSFLPITKVADAQKLVAFFLKLRGKEGYFRAGDPGWVAQGSGAGTPLVNGASQTGRTLVTDGWTASASGVLISGDWFQVGDRAYCVLEDVNADGGGNATIDIWPRLRESPANNAALTLTAPKTLFRLLNNQRGWTRNNRIFYDGFSIPIVEKLP